MFWSTYSFVRLSLQKQWETHRCEQSEGWGRGAQGRAGWPRRTWCSWKPTQGTTRTQSRWKAQAPLEQSLSALAGVVQGLHIRLPQREAHPPSLREDLQPMFSEWQCPRLLRPHLQVPPPHLRMLEAIFFTNDYQFNRKYISFVYSVVCLGEIYIYRTFDTDGNGYIDFKEFLLAIDITSSGTAEEKLGWAFRWVALIIRPGLCPFQSSGFFNWKKLLRNIAVKHMGELYI